MLTSPFPDTPDPITVPLPLPVSWRTGILSELTFVITKTSEREYIADGHKMFAVAYQGVSDLGSNQFALLTNAYTGRVPECIAAIAEALARYKALVLAYENQIPPLALPANPGVFSPLSSEAISVLDGTARFRGLCGGIHSLAPALVATVNIGFAPSWGVEP